MVAACGGAPATPADPAATPPADGTYPVRIEHEYGSTEISAEPQRIVLVGLNEQDAMLALGSVPVGTSNFLDASNGIHPWAEEALGAAPRPTLLDQTDGISYEEVAALDPDLIIGLYSGLTPEGYSTLTAIAPTVAQPAGQEDYTISWQDRTRGRLLASLGFTVPPALDAYISSDGFGGTVPGEQVSTLDVDALVWLADASTDGVLRGDALYTSLNLVTQGREVLVLEGDPVSNTVSSVTPLSIPLILDDLVPRLSAAVDGDPATATTGAA